MNSRYYSAFASRAKQKITHVHVTISGIPFLAMKIPLLKLPSSFPKSLNELTGKIPDNMKTVSVERRHILTITHAVPSQHVLAKLPALPANLALDTLKIAGENCALLQSVLMLNDNFRYTPLPMPSLDFWQLDFRVLVRENESSTRTRGAWNYQTFVGTRVAWALGRAVAGEATYADFNVIVRGAPGHEYAALIADIVIDNQATTQFAISATDDKSFAAPFANWSKMTEFLVERPRAWSRFSVGEKVGSMTLEQPTSNPMAVQFMPVGGEIREARFSLWESSGLMSASDMRRPFSVLLQPHLSVVLSSPTLS